MSKLEAELLTYPPQIVKSRVETLKAELARKHETYPEKMLAWVLVTLALGAVGLIFSFSSLMFILPTLLIGCFCTVNCFSSWCLRSNLRISQAALAQLTSEATLPINISAPEPRPLVSARSPWSRLKSYLRHRH